MAIGREPVVYGEAERDGIFAEHSPQLLHHQHTLFVEPCFGNNMSTRRSFLRPSSSLARAIVLP